MTTLNGEPLNVPNAHASLAAVNKRKRSESVDDVKLRQTRHSTPSAQDDYALLRRAEQSTTLVKDSVLESNLRSLKRVKIDPVNGDNDSKPRLPQDFIERLATVVSPLVQNLQDRDADINSAATNQKIKQINLSRQVLEQTYKDLSGENATDENGASAKMFGLQLTSQTDRGPRQLYTGLAQGNGDGKDQDIDMAKLESIAESLPNGISLSTLTSLPGTSTDAENHKRQRTFGDVFRPSRSLKGLEVPRSSRNSIRGSSLDWVGPDDAATNKTPTFKSDSRYASLPTGSWLQYTSGDTASSQESKRRQRRGLSFNETRPENRPESGEERSDGENARTRALFHSVYSSFAPSFDDSAAAIPEKVRSWAWWNRVGRKRHETPQSFEYPDPDADLSDLDVDVQLDDQPKTIVKELPIEEWPLQHEIEHEEETEAEDLLLEVADLLQTLSSYQRMRNLSKDTADAVKVSTEEQSTYETLRTSLAFMVNQLPPFAVSKLKGDQLEELNVQLSVLTDGPDHSGNLEHDTYALQRQMAQLPAAARSTVQAAASRAGAATPTARPATTRPMNPAAPFTGPRVGPLNQARGPYNTPTPRMSPLVSAANTPQHYAGRPTPMQQRPGFPSQLHYPNQSFSQGASASQYRAPSGLPNGYNSSFSTPNMPNMQSRQSVAQSYSQQRQSPAGSSQAPALATSPQKAQTPQPMAGRAGINFSPQGTPIQHQPVTNQVTMTDQARAQLLAAHRQAQLAANGANGQMGHISPIGRVSTPGGGMANGRAANAE